MNNHLLISFLAFVIFGITLSCLSYIYLYQHRAKMWRDRILGDSPSSSPSPRSHISEGIFTLQKQIGQIFCPRDELAIGALRHTLEVAGYRDKAAPYIFWGIKIFLAGIMIIGFFLVPQASSLPLFSWMLWGLIVAFIGLYSPDVFVHFQRQKRQRLILDAFPDALDLMVVCVEAGLALDATIARVGGELQLGYPELSKEFELLSLELRSGLSQEQAFRNFSRRIELDEVRSLTTLLIQTIRFGTSMGQALRVHADSMRKKRQAKAEELAGKLPVKLLFPLIFFVFPMLLVVLMGPAIIRIIRTLLPALRSVG